MLADLLCSGLVAMLLCASILVWHSASQALVLPFGDGAHHAANVASRAADFSARGPASIATTGIQDVSLAYLFFLVPSVLVGGGRLAFGFGWCACVLCILLSIWFF